MKSINEVTIDQIERLTDVQLTDLLSRLLNLEAINCGLPLSQIHVPLKITVADGGVDGRIFIPEEVNNEKWLKYSNDFLGSKTTIFQCKATKFDKSHCKREITEKRGRKYYLKPKIKQVFENQGRYVLFYKFSLNEDSINERIKSFKDAIRSCKESFDIPPDIKVYDANKIKDWVNLYPPAMLYVYECNHMHKAFAYETWKKWTNHPEFETEFHKNEILQGYIDELQLKLSKPKAIARIIGLSGLGKTRLVAETFRPKHTENIDRQSMLSSQVVYYDAKESVNVWDYVIDLRNRDRGGILIIDNCDSELHNRLRQIVTHNESQLSLLTIDNDLKGDNYFDDLLIKLEPEKYQNIIDKILDSQISGLPPEYKVKINRFAQGFPAIAVMLAQDLTRGHTSLGQLNDNMLVEKLIGSKYRDADFMHVLRACSIFTYIGFFEGKTDIREFITHNHHICRLNISSENKSNFFYAVCLEMIDRGIMERRGDYIFVKPIPLALRLAAEWWNTCRPEIINELLNQVREKDLTKYLCDQLALLNRLPSAKKVGEDLCGIKGPFGNAKVLNTDQGSRAFRSLVEVNPEATSDTLFRLFAHLNIDELKAIKLGRRHLVWALEKLVFRKATFHRASQVLLAFAAGENESISNNATGQFLQLFHLFLSGTEADLNARWQIIDIALNHKLPAYKSLGLSACLSALQSRHFVRTGGAEDQGSDTPLKDYEPKGLEIKEYWSNVINRLTTIALSETQENNTALNYLVSCIPSICDGGGSELVLTSLNLLLDHHNLDRVQVARQIQGVLSNRTLFLTPIIRKSFEEVLTKFSPKSLEEQYRSIVVSPLWDYDAEDYDKVENKHKEDIEDFTKQLIQEENWHQYIPVFLSENGYYENYFGKVLATCIGFDKLLINVITRVIIEQQGRGLNALLGYTSNLNRSDAEVLIQQFQNEKALLPYVVLLVNTITPTFNDLQTLIQLVKENKIDVDSLLSFRYGRALDHLSVEECVTFFDDIFKINEEGEQVAIILLGQYIYSHEDKRNACREFIIMTISQIKFDEDTTIPSEVIQYWLDLSAQEIQNNSNEELARAITRQIVQIAKNTYYYLSENGRIYWLVKELLNRYWDVVFPILADGLLSSAILSLKELLGCKNNNAVYYVSKTQSEKGDKEGLLFEEENYYEKIIDWCKDIGEEGILRIVYIMPFRKEGNLHPFASQMIDLFGQIPGFFKEIDANIGSFSSVGSSISYYKELKNAISSLSTHSTTEVRLWANSYLNYLDDSLKEEKKFLDERDII